MTTLTANTALVGQYLRRCEERRVPCIAEVAAVLRGCFALPTDQSQDDEAPQVQEKAPFRRPPLGPVIDLRLAEDSAVPEVDGEGDNAGSNAFVAEDYLCVADAVAACGGGGIGGIDVGGHSGIGPAAVHALIAALLHQRAADEDGGNTADNSGDSDDDDDVPESFHRKDTPSGAPKSDDQAAQRVSWRFLGLAGCDGGDAVAFAVASAVSTSKRLSSRRRAVALCVDLASSSGRLHRRLSAPALRALGAAVPTLRALSLRGVWGPPARTAAESSALAAAEVANGVIDALAALVRGVSAVSLAENALLWEVPSLWTPLCARGIARASTLSILDVSGCAVGDAAALALAAALTDSSLQPRSNGTSGTASGGTSTPLVVLDLRGHALGSSGLAAVAHIVLRSRNLRVLLVGSPVASPPAEGSFVSVGVTSGRSMSPLPRPPSGVAAGCDASSEVSIGGAPAHRHDHPAAAISATAGALAEALAASTSLRVADVSGLRFDTAESSGAIAAFLCRAPLLRRFFAAGAVVAWRAGGLPPPPSEGIANVVTATRRRAGLVSSIVDIVLDAPPSSAAFAMGLTSSTCASLGDGAEDGSAFFLAVAATVSLNTRAAASSAASKGGHASAVVRETAEASAPREAVPKAPAPMASTVSPRRDVAVGRDSAVLPAETPKRSSAAADKPEARPVPRIVPLPSLEHALGVAAAAFADASAQKASLFSDATADVAAYTASAAVAAIWDAAAAAAAETSASAMSLPPSGGAHGDVVVVRAFVPPRSDEDSAAAASSSGADGGAPPPFRATTVASPPSALSALRVQRRQRRLAAAKNAFPEPTPASASTAAQHWKVLPTTAVEPADEFAIADALHEASSDYTPAALSLPPPTPLPLVTMPDYASARGFQRQEAPPTAPAPSVVTFAGASPQQHPPRPHARAAPPGRSTVDDTEHGAVLRLASATLPLAESVARPPPRFTSRRANVPRAATADSPVPAVAAAAATQRAAEGPTETGHTGSSQDAWADTATTLFPSSPRPNDTAEKENARPPASRTNGAEPRDLQWRNKPTHASALASERSREGLSCRADRVVAPNRGGDTAALHGNSPDGPSLFPAAPSQPTARPMVLPSSLPPLPPPRATGNSPTPRSAGAGAPPRSDAAPAKATAIADPRLARRVAPHFGSLDADGDDGDVEGQPVSAVVEAALARALDDAVATWPLFAGVVARMPAADVNALAADWKVARGCSSADVAAAAAAATDDSPGDSPRGAARHMAGRSAAVATASVVALLEKCARRGVFAAVSPPPPRRRRGVDSDIDSSFSRSGRARDALAGGLLLSPSPSPTPEGSPNDRELNGGSDDSGSAARDSSFAAAAAFARRVVLPLPLAALLRRFPRFAAAVAALSEDERAVFAKSWLLRHALPSFPSTAAAGGVATPRPGLAVPLSHGAASAATTVGNGDKSGQHSWGPLGPQPYTPREELLRLVLSCHANGLFAT